MRFEILQDGVKITKPVIQRDEKGQLRAIGQCFVKHNELDCYGWEHEDTLLILDKIDADPNDIPVNQYFCMNLNKQEDTGWVMEDQIMFELKGYFGDTYKIQKI